jgi:DNA helicase-2/ATP-dependent DNA helicase PcrA
MNKNNYIGSLRGPLSTEQRRAVAALHGPLLVLAGAGTGKTRVVTYRIANLLSQNVRPENILAVTFTKKAAREMKDRVSELVGHTAREMRISTFHSLGFSILREHFDCVGLRPGFRVYADDQGRTKVVDQILRELDLTPWFDGARMLRGISLAKNRDVETDGLFSGSPDEQLLAEAFERYNTRLRAANYVDLDDLVALPLRILREQPAVRESYQKRFRYILVDEYQDTNEVQYQLMKLLLSPERNLCVVGDDDQAIYGFRGSSVEKIRGFADEFPGTVCIRLTRNYRSSHQILSFSNAVISEASKRMKKELTSELGDGVAVELGYAGDEAQERRFIANRIRELERPYEEIAILVRVIEQLRAMVSHLTAMDVPVRKKQSGGVRVLTLHGSKGLEWPVVFLPGLEEDTLPHWNAIQAGEDAVEEERRLFYVGTTRAQRQLIISSSSRRGAYRRTPSRFLDGFDQERYVKPHRVRD